MPPAPAAPAAKTSDREMMRRSQARATDSGAPTKTDTARLKRDMRAAEAEQSRPYIEEQEREDAERAELDRKRGKDSGGDGRGRAATGSGAGGVRVGGRRARPTNVLRGQRVVAGGTPIEEGAGVLLGIVLYALLLNFVRYGPDGVRGWLAAKFINQPYAPALKDTPPPPKALTPTPAPTTKATASTLPYPVPNQVPALS